MLKTLFLIAVLAIFGWMFLKRINAANDVEKAAKKVDNQATRYVSALQNDVKKAEDAQKKANAAIKQEVDTVKQSLKDAGGGE